MESMRVFYMAHLSMVIEIREKLSLNGNKDEQ